MGSMGGHRRGRAAGKAGGEKYSLIIAS